MSLPQCHEAARQYLARGWSATAFCPPDHLGAGRSHCFVCSTPGKVPLYAWKQLQEQRLPLWHLDHLFKAHPNANVGVVLGPVSKLIGIDVDGEGGKQMLIDLSHGNLPRTLCFSTGKGWRLLYALAEGEKPPANRKLESPQGGRLEVLSRGLCTVMPPSRHPDGLLYEWRRGPDMEPAPLPGWVYEISSMGRSTRPGYEPLQEGQPIVTYRNERLFRVSCAIRRHGISPAEILEFLRIVNRRCEPPLEESELRHIARSAGRYQPTEVYT